MAHSDFYSIHGHYKTRLVLHPLDSNGRPVDAAFAASGLLKDIKVNAIIGPQKSTQAIVMDLGERAHVPIISFSATSPSLIDRAHYFVQTAQSDANQVQAIASIIEKFKWRQVMIIYEDTKFGNDIVPYLSLAIQDVKAQVPYKSMLPRFADDDFISEELQKLKTMEARVFVVHTSQFLGNKLFLKASELGMMTEGYAWIVTSGLTDLFNLADSAVVEAMQGVLGVRPVIPDSRELQSFAANLDIKPTETSMFGLWAYDTLWALAMAAEVVGIHVSNVTQNEANVDSTKPFTLGVSETGPKLLKALLETRFKGVAGEFKLVDRQLEPTAYEVVNIVESIKRPVGTWMRSGGIFRKQYPNVTSSNLTATKSFRSIIWPGDSITPPRGWKVKKLRIAVPKKSGFNELLDVSIDPVTNKILVSGFYRKVFDAVMNKLPYDLQYDFFPYPMDDGSPARSYADLVHQVSLQNYDGALGDITITPSRFQQVDFTMPYAEGGVACIVPIKYEDVNGLFTFIKPLSKRLWLTTALFYIVTGVVVWILSKRILQRYGDLPGQRAGMIGYIPFIPGEGIEPILVCLVLVTWAFVASLLNSTYTANLTSRLTVASLQPSVTDVNQLMKDGKHVGCQEGSFLVGFLNNRGFNETKIKQYKSVAAFQEALSSENQSISAYCDVMPHIRHILSQSCGKYVMIDPIYRTDGFALAFPKGFWPVSDISKAIIQLTEDGILQEMEQPPSGVQQCPGDDQNSSHTRVSLRSFVLLFAITGFVTLTCLAVSLLIHLHNEGLLLQRISHLFAIIRARTLALWKNLTDFVAFTMAIILALWNDFRPNQTTNTRDDIVQVEMGSSSLEQ